MTVIQSILCPLPWAHATPVQYYYQRHRHLVTSRKKEEIPAQKTIYSQSLRNGSPVVASCYTP